MQNLTAAGLVESRCGANGGYRLAKSADGITILDVVHACEPVGEFATARWGWRRTPRCARYMPNLIEPTRRPKKRSPMSPSQNY